MLAKEAKKHINDIRATTAVELSLLAPWAKITDVLLSTNIAYFAELSCTVVLCHPKNTGGLGLNPHNIHKNGASIKKAGADDSELCRATCFELSSDAATRATQIKFNEDLAESSEEVFVPVTGQERNLSVSCGHFSGFCIAALARCKKNGRDLRRADREGQPRTIGPKRSPVAEDVELWMAVTLHPLRGRCRVARSRRHNPICT